MAGQNIWQLQARGDIPGIISALESPDPMIRSRAVRALQTLNATEAVPQLQALHSHEHHPQIRALLDEALHTLQQDTPADNKRDLLLKKLQSPKADEVYQAINELGDLGDRTVVEPLVILFRDVEQPAKLRLAAAEALLKLESTPASASLLGALRKPDWQVRRNAAGVLGQLKADWAVEPLIKVLWEDPHSAVRQTALAALRHIETPQAQAAVQEYLQRQYGLR